MNIISAVANLVKEKDYYKESFEECQAIIRQLSGSPIQFEYIHPFDLADMLNSVNSNSIVDIYFVKTHGKENNIIEANGKRYKQSTFIPAKTKSFK